MSAPSTPAADRAPRVASRGEGGHAAHTSLSAWADTAYARWRRQATALVLQRLWPASALLACVVVWRGGHAGWAAVLTAVVPPVVAMGWGRRVTPRRAFAPALEARVPTSRNLLLTALELAERGADATLVYTRALALVAALHVRALFPVSVARLAVSAALSLALVGAASRVGPVATSRDATRAVDGPLGGAPDPSAALRITSLEVEVTPPAYRGEAGRTMRSPRRLDVPDGSRLAIRVRAPGADSVTVSVVDARDALTRTDADFALSWQATRDAVLSFAAWRGAEVARTLLGVRVQPDAAPRVRIVTPGRDLVLPRADTSLRVSIEADDDLALASLVLRYTKVSGSGERYAFSEGEVPLRVQRVSRARWTATAEWSLAPLSLAPGDVVVYRAVAADRRPDAAPVESDAWLAELPAGRGDGAAGFAVDVGELRYALSQQMIVLRIERLLAARDSVRRVAARRDSARATLDGERFVQQAANIAIEQRRVRAEFVFMMGGELADEVTNDDVMGDLDEHQHAEVDADLSAGRVRNEGRAAVLAAIRAMSRTTTALADTLLPEALRNAREAVAQLERAFSTARFLMRPLAEREAIDQTRRLTGSLLGVTGSTLPRAEATRDLARAAWQDALRGLQAPSAEWMTAAATLARLDDTEAQTLALALADAAERRARGDVRSAEATRDSVAVRIGARLTAVAPDAPRAARSARAALLDGVRLAQPVERRTPPSADRVVPPVRVPR